MAATDLTKVTYVDGTTVIGATNLNAIQDTVKAHKTEIDALETTLTAAVNGKVSKSSTSGTFAYTHVGSLDGEKAITETPTASAIPMYGTGGVLKAGTPSANNDVARKTETDALDAKADSIKSTFVNSAYPAKTLFGNPVSFKDGANNVPVRDLKVHLEPVQSGSGDPSPSNVRAISGFTQCKIYRRSKNLIQPQNGGVTAGVTYTVNSDGTITANGTATSLSTYTVTGWADNTIPAGNYLFTAGVTPYGGTSMYDCGVWDSTDSKYAPRWDGLRGSSCYTDKFIQVKLEKGHSYQIYIHVRNGYNIQNVTFKPMLCSAITEDATFEKSARDRYDISFPSEAGTVYGGTVDVTTGVLTVDRVKEQFVFSDSNKVTLTNYTRKQTTLAHACVYPPKKGQISNVAPYKADFNGDYLHFYCNAVGSCYMFLPNGTSSSTTYEVCYELATPITYQLTATEITTLLGMNNIWSDGGTVEVNYNADEITDISDIVSALATDTITDQRVALFPDGADGIAVKDLVAHIEPVQAGSGDPSPTNIRAISGWTGVNVIRTGKNICPPPVVGLTFGSNTGLPSTSTNSAATGYIFVDFNKYNYYFTNTDNNPLFIHAWDKSGAYVGRADGQSRHSEQLSKTMFQYGSDGNRNYDGIKYIAFDFYQGTNMDINTVQTAQIQLEIGTTGTAYEPYVGSTYPVTFPTNVGTVYGGTLDVKSGVLTTDTIGKVFNGSETWNYVAGGNDKPMFRYVVSGYTTKTDQTLVQRGCSHFENKTVTTSSTTRGYASYTSSGQSTIYMQIYPLLDGISSLNDWKSWITTQYSNGTPLTCWTSVNEKTTYQLTPTEVTTLLGYNNIWADTGNTDVTYRADTGLYIQKLTGSTEEDLIANANIASGKYFMVGNTLYLSTSAIAAGEAIVPGTSGNCTLTNLAAALNALNT